MARPEEAAPPPAVPVTRAPPTPMALAGWLEELRDEMRARHHESRAVFADVHPVHRRSAHNLVDYLTLRRHDVRAVQSALAELGVSSLGRAEEHVLQTVERVIDVLWALEGLRSVRTTGAAVGFGEGRQTLETNAVELLGPPPPARDTRIMVTMPPQAALDQGLVDDLVARGMDCARVNTAHDEPEAWEAMVANLRRASERAGRRCRILVDLPGPKLRTGPVASGPRVVRLRPQRDGRGQAVAPATAVLVPASGRSPVEASGTEPADGEHRATAGIPVPGDWIRHLHAGDQVTLRDARGARRLLTVTDTDGAVATVQTWHTTYIETGTTLATGAAEAAVGRLRAVEQSLRVRLGDTVTLSSDVAPALPTGRSGVRETDRAQHWRIGCTLPAAIAAARRGHRVWFDDGKIGGVVTAVRTGEFDVEVTACGSGGANLRGGRGINLPDSHLELPILRPEDEVALRFAAARADMVGLSFVQRPADVIEVHRRIAAHGGTDTGIVLKIETAAGFQRLPELLLAGMTRARLGVMVARGDLAVECGFERLAELQEEILWLCDAGHVPVIWATQVLDQMARTGLPSRAEVSDAVMAARAECVMLNKGPYIVGAVASLDDILRRMEGHQHKKVPLLRRLRSWAPEVG